MYAKPANSPEPKASNALESILSKSGETIRIIPIKAVISRTNTEDDTFSLINRPESNATNNGAVYCNVTAWPIGINDNAVKYSNIAINPVRHRKNIFLLSFTLRLMP